MGLLIPRRLSVRASVGATALLKQRRAHTARDMHIVHSTIVLVLAGRKIATASSVRAVARPGELMLLPAGTLVDLANEPGPEGEYEAVSVALDLSVAHFAAPDVGLVSSVEALIVEDGFRTALMRAREVVIDHTVPLAVARHAAAEVSTWLAVHGRHFASERSSHFADRLRALIADDLTARWDTAAAASLMAVSEATLRRRLAKAGVSLTGLLQDVRMAHALSLLQASDEPVVQIALACGYGDHAHFSRRFKARFGLRPTEFRSPVLAV